MKIIFKGLLKKNGKKIYQFLFISFKQIYGQRILPFLKKIQLEDLFSPKYDKRQKKLFNPTQMNPLLK